MAQLVIGVIRNVLRHVAIQIAQRGDVGWISSLDAAQFIVLLPQVGLDQFHSSREAQSAASPLESFPVLRADCARVSVLNKAPAETAAVAIPMILRKERRSTNLANGAEPLRLTKGLVRLRFDSKVQLRISLLSCTPFLLVQICFS